MKSPLLSFAVALGACGSSKVDAPSCADAVAQASKRVGGEVARGIDMCTRDAWSPELRTCVAAAATQDALLQCMARFRPARAPAPARPGALPARDDTATARALVRRYLREAFPL